MPLSYIVERDGQKGPFSVFASCLWNALDPKALPLTPHLESPLEFFEVVMSAKYFLCFKGTFN